MTSDDFWKLIDKIDRQTLQKGEGFDEEAVEPLIGVISDLSRDELEAFEEHLANALHELDGRRFAEAAGDTGDDAFLYARCFVVAMGRDTYNRTIHDPTLMPKSTDEWCEPLLYVAGAAWQRKTGEDWDYSPRVNFETGSNTAQW